MHEQTALLRKVRQALQQENYAEAIDALTQLTSLARRMGDHAAVARHQGNLGLLYHRLGQLDAALEHVSIALESARAEGDRAMESGLLGNAGNILRESGHQEKAISYLENALALAVDANDERGRGIWLSNLALVYDDLGQYNNAIPLHEQSVIVARKLRDLRGLAARLGHLAESYIAYDDAPSALIHLQEAVMIDRDLGDKPMLARRLSQIGYLFVVLGQRTTTRQGMIYCFQRAVEHYRQSISSAYDAGDSLMQAELLGTMGNIFLRMGDYDQAINHLDTAYQMFSGLGMNTPLAELQTAVEQARAARHAHSLSPV